MLDEVDLQSITSYSRDTHLILKMFKLVCLISRTQRFIKNITILDYMRCYIVRKFPVYKQFRETNNSKVQQYASK